MKNKIIIMKGLPGSGKSTKAKELLSLDKNAVRVNKGTLREMAFFSEYTPKREGIIDNMQFRIVDNLLKSGKNVIIDDTNFGNRIQRINDYFKGTPIEIVEMDTPIAECVKRDSARIGRARVGKSVITNMALANGHILKKPVVIVDVDGTIADLSHRLPYIKDGNKDWGTFFDKAWLDQPIQENIIDINYRYPSDKYDRVILSGRPDSIRRPTEEWLDEHFVYYTTLIMRSAGDHRGDDIVKRELYDKYLANQNVVAVFDDRPRVLRVWKEIGIPEINDVGPGVEF